MKKGKLLTVSLSLIMLLVGCDTNTSSSTSSTTSSSTPSSIATSSSSSSTSSTPSSSVESSEQSSSSVSTDSTSISSDTTSSIESSVPVKDKAVISRVVNLVSEGTLNVKEGDKVDIDATITLTFETAISDATYEIAVNKTVSDMIWSEDKLSCSFTLSATKDEELTIGVIKKNLTSETGKVITFTQGEHYVIFGITSGCQYQAGLDDQMNEINTYFGIIADDGYIISKVEITPDDDYGTKLTSKTGRYEIYQGCILKGNNTLTVTVEKPEKHKITYTGIDHIDMDKSNLPYEFTGLDKVKFSIVAADGFTVTDVEFDPDIYLGYSVDYSSFEVTLPNKDVTVSITTAKNVAIELESSEHLSNVEFFANTGDVQKNEAGKTVIPMANKITSWAPSSYNYFFMVCNVEDGFKIYSIEGADSSSSVTFQKYYYDTVDGRVVYKIYLKADTKLKVTLVTQKTVSLDSSVDSEKVSLFFDNDANTFYPGDSVGFDTILTDDAKTKVSKVSYCYTDDSGTPVEKVISASTSSYDKHAYNFTMPNGNVTIKVAVVDVVKATVSYTSTASTLLRKVTFTGASSKTKLDSTTTTSNSFEVGEEVKIEANLNNISSKSIKFVIVQTGEEIVLTQQVIKTKYKGSFFVPEGGCSITISEVDKTVRTVTTPENSTIEFYTSSDPEDKVETLGDLYDGDVFYFVVKDEVAEGKFLDVRATCDGELVTLTPVTIGDETGYKVTVNGDVEIKVSQSEGVKFTMTYNGKAFDGSEFVFDADTNENVVFVNGCIKKGTRFYVSDPDNGRLIGTITIGGETVKGTWDGDIFKYVYEATGDVVIDLIDEE